MRESVSGFSVIRALLLVAGIVVLLITAFWVALVVIAVAAVYAVARFVVRALTGRGRKSKPADATIIIQPGHRQTYDNGNVIVLPLDASRVP